MLAILAGKALWAELRLIKKCLLKIDPFISQAIFLVSLTGMDGTRRRPYIGLRRWPICNGHAKSPEKLLAINSLGGG
jgi:hypothetical protein